MIVLNFLGSYIKTDFTINDEVNEVAFFVEAPTPDGTVLKLFPSNFFGVGFMKRAIIGVNYESPHLLRFNIERNGELATFKIVGINRDSWLVIEGGKLTIGDAPFEFQIEERTEIDVITEIPKIREIDLDLGPPAMFEILFHHRLMFATPVTEDKKDKMNFIYHGLGPVVHGSLYKCFVRERDPIDVLKFMNFYTHKDRDRFSISRNYFCVRIHYLHKEYDLCREPLSEENTPEILRDFYAPKIELITRILERYDERFIIKMEIHSGVEFKRGDDQELRSKREVELAALKRRFMEEYKNTNSDSDRVNLKEKYRMLFVRLTEKYSSLS